MKRSGDLASTLQQSLLKDFSERVLLLHGLSGWPSPLGSYFLCEVDLSDADPIGRKKAVQFVLQAIPGIFSGGRVTIGDTSRLGGEPTSESRKIEHGNIGRLHPENWSFQRAEDTFTGQHLQKETSETSVNSSYPTCICSDPLQDENETLFEGEEYLYSFFGDLVVLAPDVNIVRTSYKALVSIVRDLHGRVLDCDQEEMVRTCGDPYQDLLKQHTDGRIRSEGSQGTSNGKDNNDVLHCSGRLRHPNLAPILGVLQGELYLYVVYPATAFTMQSLLYFSPDALGDDQQLRFLIFQILSAMAFTHRQGLSHRDLRPSHILMTDNLWCWITGFLRVPERKIAALSRYESPSSSPAEYDEDFGLTGRSKALGPERSLIGYLSGVRSVIRRWWAGEVSNYDYLLLLNKLALRRWADPCFHTVMPWVIDFTVKPDEKVNLGWRDLTKSKWRLAKGDEQLDFTYASADMPHHVSDECLSELAVCIYKARRLPLLLLRRVVRSVYEPNEYPTNMQRLYDWTPDECIPDFYSDPHIFESIHPGMNDLAVPTWAIDEESFISLHRAALESNRVSRELHHWIDLTFGYKLSGEAAVSAKNVTLSSVGPTVPRSIGRRQLFSEPHPQRRQPCKTTDVMGIPGESLVQRMGSQMRIDTSKEKQQKEISDDTVDIRRKLIAEAHNYSNLNSGPFGSLELLEEITLFSESARHLSPCYNLSLDSENHHHESAETCQGKSKGSLAVPELSLQTQKGRLCPCNLDTSFPAVLDGTAICQTFLEILDEEDYGDILYGSLGSLNEGLDHCKQASVGQSEDIFAMGCLIAELFLRRPLFDPDTAIAYRSQGRVPDIMESLPPSVQCLVKSAIRKEPALRPTALELLNSTFFSSTIRAAYSHLAPLQLLSNRHDRLQYVARMARVGAFASMGQPAAELCTPSFLTLIVPPYEDIDVDAIASLIRNLLQALKPRVSKKLLVPVVQKLLQNQLCPQLKLVLLQISFISELWKVVGTGPYLQSIHLSVLESLRHVPSKSLASAASKTLVSMSSNLGVPITLHQTVFPLLQSFGRDITVDQIDAFIGISEYMGEKLVVKHLLPPLRTVIESNVDLLPLEGPGPVHSWRLLSMVDAMAVLDRLRSILRPSVVLKELLQEPHNVYVKLLLQLTLSPSLRQCAAKALLLVCDYVGAEATVVYVLPQLKKLFDGLAFAGKLAYNQEAFQSHGSQRKSQLFSASETQSGVCNLVSADMVEDDMRLVHILYPGLASLIGIERLRQALTTWLLLEQALLKHCNWKWEASDLNQLKNPEKILLTEFGNEPVNPAILLLDGVGWSTPLSQGSKWSKSSSSSRRLSEVVPEKSRSVPEFENVDESTSWSWFACKDILWDAETFARIGSGFGLAEDDQTWGFNFSILHSWRAHDSLVRSTSVSEDENTIFTAGGGPRDGSIVRGWKLGSRDCIVEYAGHEEAVNDVCVLPGGRVVSCDGTIHLWTAQTGQRIALFDESASSSISSSLSTTAVSSALPVLNPSPGESSRITSDLRNGNGSVMDNHGLTASLSGGGLYTCMHSMEAEERLLAGMFNGSLRFIDIERGYQLYSWRCAQTERSLSSLVSAIASSGQGQSMEGRKYSLRSSWIVVGFGSGLCQLMDCTSGEVVAQWQAHTGFITQLCVLEERYLVSSALDKTICIWDLRRGVSPGCLQLFQCHKQGVRSFGLRGCDLLSAAGSKVGLSRLSKSATQGEEQLIQLQKLYSDDRSDVSLPNITTISVLPYSRLLLIGADDGYLRICS